MIGFTIYGPEGTNILEGNTFRLKHETGKFSIGQTLDITWEVPNIFASGTYSVSVACSNKPMTQFYEWFNNASSFVVRRDSATAGVVDPKIQIAKYDLNGDGGKI